MKEKSRVPRKRVTKRDLLFWVVRGSLSEKVIIKQKLKNEELVLQGWDRRIPAEKKIRCKLERILTCLRTNQCSWNTLKVGEKAKNQDKNISGLASQCKSVGFIWRLIASKQLKGIWHTTIQFTFYDPFWYYGKGQKQQ